MPDSRATIVERLRKKVAAGLPIIGGGAGTGISAKCEEAGGIDLIVIYNSGRFRMAGRGSMAGLMPYGNANAIVKEMAREVLTAVRHTPVLAGVCASDPFMLRDHFLRELKDMGFAGIQNFPTVGLIDGVFRANLEETGMGFDLEIDLIAAAHQLDLLTTPYAFDPDQSRLLAQAGADIVVAHMGLTTKGTIGARTARTLDDCVGEVAAIAEAGKSARDDLLVLCHGGPIADPGDAQYILDRVPSVRRVLRRQLDGTPPHRDRHRPAGPRFRGHEAIARRFLNVVDAVPGREPMTRCCRWAIRSSSRLANNDPWPVLIRSGSPRGVGYVRASAWPGQVGSPIERVRQLEGRVEPVGPQGGDHLAVACVFRGLGDVGVGPGTGRFRSTSSSRFEVVRTITGMIRSLGSALIRLSTWHPSSPGRLRSSRIRSGSRSGSTPSSSRPKR